MSRGVCEVKGEAGRRIERQSESDSFPKQYAPSKPGPTPLGLDGFASQGKTAEKKITGSSVPIIQSLFTPLLDVDKTNLSTGDRKILELITRRISSGNFTQDQLNTYSHEIERIRSKSSYLEKAVSSSKRDATWGTEMINKQSAYSHKTGTFGPWGSLAANGCGAFAINNANQILGFNTEFSDLSYNLNQNSELTTNIGGWLGMNPLVVGDYYRQNGAKVTLYTNPTDVSKDHDAYIALFFHSGGAHYVAAEYNSSTKKFEVYNLDSDEKEKSLVSLSRESYHHTAGWIIWGIDSPINTSDDYSNNPFERSQPK